jgi:hypothetical protein
MLSFIICTTRPYDYSKNGRKCGTCFTHSGAKNAHAILDGISETRDDVPGLSEDANSVELIQVRRTSVMTWMNIRFHNREPIITVRR